MRGKPKLIKLTDGAGNLKSPYWYIQYYDGGRSKRQTTGCEIGAQDHAAQIFFSTWLLERERPTAREPDKLMVAQALKDYYDEHAQYLASAKHARYHEARLKAHFGLYFVNQLTQAGVGAYIRERQTKEESNGTIRRDLEHLKAALNHEVREQRLIYAPKFKMPPPPAPRQKTLSGEEIARLLEECKTPHVKHFVQIMLNTGQRPAAVENLTWFQVDFEERVIHFERTGKQQTNKRARSVPINQRLMELLGNLHREKKTEYVLEYKGEHAGNVKKAFARAAARAGLDDVSRYTLRHTFANMLDDALADEKTIGEIMGHTKSRTTRTHYIKAKMNKLRLAVDLIGGEK